MHAFNFGAVPHHVHAFGFNTVPRHSLGFGTVRPLGASVPAVCTIIPAHREAHRVATQSRRYDVNGVKGFQWDIFIGQGDKFTQLAKKVELVEAEVRAPLCLCPTRMPLNARR